MRVALLLLSAFCLPTAAQPPPGTVDVASYAQLFDAVVNQQAASVRVVAHISYALAGDSVNVSSAVSVFGDAALCAASAAALDVSLFSADQTTFVSCTLDAAGAPWRHFTVYAAGRSNFSDLAFLNGGGTSLDASTGSGGAVASVYVAPNAFNPRMLFTRCSFVGNAAGGGVYGGAVYSSFKCAALRDDPPFCARH